MTQTLLVGTWTDGVHVFAGGSRHHELAGQSVRGLARDEQGRAVALVGGHSICRRTHHAEGGTQPTGTRWETLASSEQELACSSPVDSGLLLGTDSEAALLHLDHSGVVSRVDGFDAVPGRSSWYAGQAVIDGKVVGPPLGVRSMARSADGSVTLAAVHVGGAPRSLDAGATWRPCFDIDWDVHEVAAHATRPGLFAAATALGLAISWDAGESWALHTDGLHAAYCSAVAFVGEDLLVAVSDHHFSEHGAIYRCTLKDAERGNAKMTRVGGGLPSWLGGIVDTAGLATGEAAALVDASGQLFVSDDSGSCWELRAQGVSGCSSVLVL